MVLGFLQPVRRPGPWQQRRDRQLLPAQLWRELSMMAKIDVNGANASPCTSGSPPGPGPAGQQGHPWNFTKFLVGRTAG